MTRVDHPQPPATHIRIAALALAALLALPAAPPARAGGAPDLELDYVGPVASDTRLLEFEVTNVGQGRASPGAAHGETLSPTPGNVVPNMNYPGLDPGQSVSIIYPLTEPCDGHVVKVGVSATADGEENYANNFFEGQACPKKAPAPADGPIGPAPKVIVPERLRPGAHGDGEAMPAVVLEPSVDRQHVLRRTNTGILGELDCPFALGSISREPDGAPNVGFFHRDFSGCDINEVAQLIVNFDLDWMRGIESKLLGRAELRFDEQITLGGGGTCIGRLGLAPPDWAAIVARRDNPVLLATEEVGARLPDGPGATRRWNVTGDLQRPITGANPPLAGFVLHGLDENLDAEDERACLSAVRHLGLKLTYAVLK